MNQNKQEDPAPGRDRLNRQTSDSNIREFLALPPADLEDCLGAIPEISKLIRDHASELAASITETTGKAIKWSRAEIKESIDILSMFQHLPDIIREGRQSPGYATMEVPATSNGVSVIFSDTALPLFSVISKLLPSIMTRRSTLIFPDSRSFGPADLLADILESNLPKSSALIAFRKDRLLTAPALHRPLPLDILSSGRIDLDRATKNNLTATLSAEFGSAYPVHLVPGSDLDGCAEECVRSLVSLHLPQYFRPGSITLFEEDEQYFVNRLLTELEKLKIGDPFQENVDVGVPLEVENSISVAKQILSDNGKKYDVPFWSGPQADGFGPCLITGISEEMSADIRNADLPILRVRTVSSNEEALNQWKDSGNSITGSIWSQDEGILPYVLKKTAVSVAYMNSLPRSIPGIYSNPSAGSAVTGDALALYRSMSMRRTGLLGL